MSSVVVLTTSGSCSSRPPKTKISPVGSVSALAYARGCASPALNAQDDAASLGTTTVGPMTAMKMAANKNACRIPYLELLRDLELLRGERNSSHRHGLPREPGDAFLNEIELHDVDAGLRGHRHLRVH